MTLTLDEMRRDVAALLGIDPAGIGDDDNLSDLGLDSMRLMQLVLGWEERGLRADYGIFAEEVSLAGWWAAIRAAGLE